MPATPLDAPSGEYRSPFSLHLALPRRINVTLLGMLIAVLFWPATSGASALLTVRYTGGSSYQLELKDLERVSRATITLNYQHQELNYTPLVVPTGIGLIGSLSITASSLGGFEKSLTIQYVAAVPKSGDGVLGNITLARGSGRVSGLSVSAQVQNYKGQAMDAGTELEEAPAAEEPLKDISPAAVGGGKVEGALLKTAAAAPAPAKAAAGSTRRRLKGVLEQFLALEGERTAKTLAGLAARAGAEEYRQEPPLLLSDGAAVLRVVFLPPAKFKEIPSFSIKGAEFIAYSWLETGELAVDLLPELGALKASITVVTADEQVEYPLAIAPPLEIFEAQAADPATFEFVRIANEMMRTK